MSAPIESEFKSQSHVRGFVFGIIACVVIGFIGSTFAMVTGGGSDAALWTSFVAVPLVLFVFAAVRSSATTPSVIVSDRGLERSTSDRTVVIRWADVAAVDLLFDGETTRIRYLTRDMLDGEICERLEEEDTDAAPERGEEPAVDRDRDRDRDRDIDIDTWQPDLSGFDVERVMRAEEDVIANLGHHGASLPVIPKARAEEAAVDWDDLLRAFAGDRYHGIKEQ